MRVSMKGERREVIAWRNLLFGALASGTADESLGVQKFEVAFARHSGGSQVVLDDEYGNRSVFRNHDRSYNAWFGEHHVITFGAHTTEPIGFENFDELFISNGAKL